MGRTGENKLIASGLGTKTGKESPQGTIAPPRAQDLAFPIRSQFLKVMFSLYLKLINFTRHMFLIPAPQRQRQADFNEFEASLIYILSYEP